jgi:spore coat protein U-like protein
MKTFRTAALVASIISLVSIGAFAATTTGTFGLSANVTNSCAVVAGGTLAFGNYDPAVANATSDLPGNGTLQITCTNGANPKIWMDQGTTPDIAGGSGIETPHRQMTSGTTSTKLAYQLYQQDHTTVWGGDDATGVPWPTDGTTMTVSVYGVIPHGQPVAAGAYTDTVTITLHY